MSFYPQSLSGLCLLLSLLCLLSIQLDASVAGVEDESPRPRHRRLIVNHRIMKTILKVLVWPVWWLTRDYYEAEARWRRMKRTADLGDKFARITKPSFTESPPKFWNYCPLAKKK